MIATNRESSIAFTPQDQIATETALASLRSFLVDTYVSLGPVNEELSDLVYKKTFLTLEALKEVLESKGFTIDGLPFISIDDAPDRAGITIKKDGVEIGTLTIEASAPLDSVQRTFGERPKSEALPDGK